MLLQGQPYQPTTTVLIQDKGTFIFFNSMSNYILPLERSLSMSIIVPYGYQAVTTTVNACLKTGIQQFCQNINSTDGLYILCSQFIYHQLNSSFTTISRSMPLLQVYYKKALFKFLICSHPQESIWTNNKLFLFSFCTCFILILT